MRLVQGIQHLTLLSEDLDRLAAFYERVFEARKTLDLTEEGFRHIFLEVGPTTVLHPFQIINGPALPPAPGTMFERGRLDHFALLAHSEEAFREIRRRLETEGAAVRPARDTGTAWIMDLHDPDGLYVEVIWHKPGARHAETLRHEAWTTLDLS
jgi:catechol 2,3-dioxygenase-like lactoylglutathione lyase family enzyme